MKTHDSVPNNARHNVNQDMSRAIAGRQQRRLLTLYALLSLLLVAATITAPSLLAQQASDSAREGGNDSGVFKPSEDISEDFAVPFPVDI